MAKPRNPWDIKPQRGIKIALSESFKAEVQAKANTLIEKTLKPQHILPPPPDARFNHIINISATWYRGYFYFVSTYACPGPDALTPTFEAKFARLEHLGNGKFALYAMRHTGKEWFGIFDDLSVDECMKAIADDPWFVP